MIYDNEQPRDIELRFSRGTLKTFMGWGKFFAVMTMIGGVIACIGIWGLPFGIFAIISATKFFGCCNKISLIEVMRDNSRIPMEASDDLYQHFKYRGIMMIISLIASVLIILLYVLILVAAVNGEFGSGNDFIHNMPWQNM